MIGMLVVIEVIPLDFRNAKAKVHGSAVLIVMSKGAMNTLPKTNSSHPKMHG